MNQTYNTSIRYKDKDKLSDDEKLSFCEALIKTKGICADTSEITGINAKCSICPISIGACSSYHVIKKARIYISEHGQDKDNLI